MERRPAVITSRQNPIVKQARSLHQKKFREQHRAFLVEGPRLIGELVRTSWQVRHVLYDPEVLGMQTVLAGCTDDRLGKLQAVSSEVLESISDTEHHQGGIAVAGLPDRNVAQWRPSPSSLVVVLDGVGDPGNVGSVIRTADAFRVEAVFLTDDCADPWSAKCVRATAGSCFHVPVFVLSRDTIAATLREEFQLLGASSHGNVPLDRVELADRVALVLGHETRGLSPELSECLDKTVAIPMSERVESLNVAAAAAVVCWEVFRQRRIWSAGAEQSGAPALDDRMTR